MTDRRELGAIGSHAHQAPGSTFNRAGAATWSGWDEPDGSRRGVIVDGLADVRAALPGPRSRVGLRACERFGAVPDDAAGARYADKRHYVN